MKNIILSLFTVYILWMLSRRRDTTQRKDKLKVTIDDYRITNDEGNGKDNDVWASPHSQFRTRVRN